MLCEHFNTAPCVQCDIEPLKKENEELKQLIELEAQISSLHRDEEDQLKGQIDRLQARVDELEEAREQDSGEPKGFYCSAVICNSCGDVYMKRPVNCDCGNDESMNGFESAAVFIASEIARNTSALVPDGLIEEEPDLTWDSEDVSYSYGVEGLQNISIRAADDMNPNSEKVIKILCAKKLPDRFLRVTLADDGIDQALTWAWVSHDKLQS